MQQGGGMESVSRETPTHPVCRGLCCLAHRPPWGEVSVSRETPTHPVCRGLCCLAVATALVILSSMHLRRNIDIYFKVCCSVGSLINSRLWQTVKQTSLELLSEYTSRERKVDRKQPELIDLFPWIQSAALFNNLEWCFLSAARVQIHYTSSLTGAIWVLQKKTTVVFLSGDFKSSVKIFWSVFVLWKVQVRGQYVPWSMFCQYCRTSADV